MYACILSEIRGRKIDKIVSSREYASSTKLCKDSI